MKLARPARAMSARTLFALAIAVAPGCDGDEDDAADAETGHGEHGEGDHDGGTDGADPDTRIEWTMAPPATVTAGSPVEGTFMVHTQGELHVTELRACTGHGVADCGLGQMDTFETVPAEADGDAYRGALDLEVGDYTVVGYAHVGPSPFVSDPVDVTVE